MITRKLFLVFGFFFSLSGIKTLMAQTPTNPIILNEYCVSNTPAGYPDEKGVLNDYVEIYNNHTAPINFSGFYLSNDPNNLLKWKFPANFPQLAVGNYALVWLSGKNTNDGTNFHTNFTIEQCKSQWIIISNASGVIYDKIQVQPTMAGHVRGRVDMDNIGPGAWRLFATKSPKFANGNPTAVDYAPKPQIYLTTTDSTLYGQAINPGEFSMEPPQIAIIRLENADYDSAYFCYDVFYTLNGNYPIPFYNGTNTFGTDYFRYINSTLTPITLSKTTVVRAIAVPRPTNALCQANSLPSFCETNTYFLDADHSAFDPNFGIISLSIDKADTSWFNAQGAYSPSVHVEYYDNKKQVSEGYAMLTRPSQEQWLTRQKGFYITKDDRLGSGCNFEGNIFNVEGLGTTDRKVFPTLHLKGGDYESHSPLAGVGGTAATTSFGTGIRDVLMQSLAAKYDLHVSPLHVKPVITFINGAYYGVYDLREVYDKYYEQYYNGQSPDSLDLNFVHNSQEGSVSYWDGTISKFGANFNTSVYNVVQTRPMKGNDYTKVMNAMDKESFIDYMILNSYGMNPDLWTNNVTLAKGGQASKRGGKWHFYLWNMPSAFNYTYVTASGFSIKDPATSPCFLYNPITTANLYVPTLNMYNGHGNIMTKLMNTLQGNPSFRKEYIDRYQDLLNGPLKCDNILKHFDFIAELYRKEMKYHEDPASGTPGKFATTVDTWDSNMVRLRKSIELRCYAFNEAFGKKGCYDLEGPFDLSVDVRPAGAGKVKLNTTVLDNYVWYGKYYQSIVSAKAIPSSSDYAFHHWEFRGANTNDPLSKDSIGFNIFTSTDLMAVFTDKRNDISSTGPDANLPTGFTPNGDGLNDDFRPLGSGEYATEYQMTIFNRWGQQVFRSVDPLDGWDGRYKGQEAPTGVYAYFITYKNIYSEAKLVKGNVTLTR